MEVEIFNDLKTLSSAAADLFIEQSQIAVQNRGKFCVVLSGGDTPLKTYELLAQKSRISQVAWEKTHVFWGDERCVPLDDPRSNAFHAFRLLLDRVPIPPSQIHPIYYEKSPKHSAEQYELMLHKFFKDREVSFDLMLLGLGNDGHTASLFPGNPVLNEKNKWVSEVKVPNQDFSRVTLTIPLLERSLLTLFMVFGEAKAEVLKTILEGPVDTNKYPAQLIAPLKGELVWLVDNKAAKLLSEVK